MKITLSRFWMICAGVVMLALSSCGSGGKEDVLPPTVEVKTTMIEAEGRSQYIYVKASSSWKITLTSVDGGAPVDWIIAAPSSGSGSTDVTLNVGRMSRSRSARLYSLWRTVRERPRRQSVRKGKNRRSSRILTRHRNQSRTRQAGWNFLQFRQGRIFSPIR